MSRPDRSAPPEPGTIRAFEFPAVERRELAGGLDFRLASMARLPIVSVNLFVRAGESALLNERAGLASIVGDALEGGTRRHSGTQLAEALERLGTRLGVSTGWEGTSVSLSCLAERLEEALGLLAEAVLEPEFPEDETQRAFDQALASIRQRAKDPASLAGDEAARRIFAGHVPYSRPLAGTQASVEGLRREDIVGFASEFFRPRGSGLVVVGDVPAEEIEAVAREYFGAWEGASPHTGAFPVEPDTRERRIWVVDRPGSVQSEICVGHVGVERSHPDVFPLTVLNTLLGGAFTSRLNLNLRERHGFTYGVRSSFSFRSRPGAFHVRTAVGTEATAPAVREILAELELIVREGPTDDEVAASRDYIAGLFPLRLETVGQVAGRISELVIFGLEDDYHRTYRDKVRAVTAGTAVEAARRHVRPEEVQIVVVGDAASVVPALEALAVAPVVSTSTR